jgi:hypothetical protein
MTFGDYVEIIKQSVSTEGYDQFYPSLCEAGHESRLHVLECELSDTGEEATAKAWAATFCRKDSPIYVAYRAGGLCVHVCEIRNREVTDKLSITVSQSVG